MDSFWESGSILTGAIRAVFLALTDLNCGEDRRPVTRGGDQYKHSAECHTGGMPDQIPNHPPYLGFFAPLRKRAERIGKINE